MKQTYFEFNLPVSIFKEGDNFIAYTPALDLSTSGKTFKEVKKRFQEAVQIFFEETSQRGTTEEVLAELGWTKRQKQWSPPPVIAHEPETVKIPLPALSYATHSHHSLEKI
ncbi:MAG: type II toxin-antitoxin system HicB family antitoxin [Candidatus Jacksonbacteria bacterium]